MFPSKRIQLDGAELHAASLGRKAQNRALWDCSFSGYPHIDTLVRDMLPVYRSWAPGGVIHCAGKCLYFSPQIYHWPSSAILFRHLSVAWRAVSRCALGSFSGSPLQVACWESLKLWSASSLWEFEQLSLGFIEHILDFQGQGAHVLFIIFLICLRPHESPTRVPLWVFSLPSVSYR